MTILAVIALIVLALVYWTGYSKGREDRSREVDLSEWVIPGEKGQLLTFAPLAKFKGVKS